MRRCMTDAREYGCEGACLSPGLGRPWRLFGTGFRGNRPGFGLLLIADRTVGVAEADVDRPEVLLLEKGRHRHPLGGRRAGRGDMLANTAHRQYWNGRHGNTSSNGAHCRDLCKGVQLGASLGANDANPVTE